jgi:hypothetical protein
LVDGERTAYCLGAGGVQVDGVPVVRLAALMSE